MIQAVFDKEMLQIGRRQNSHWWRWLYAAFLLVQIAPLLFFTSDLRDWSQRFASVAFFETFLRQNFIILALVTPAIVGSAITEEKSRGTLIYLLTANLWSWEIVFGKLFARITQLALLTLVGLPLFCFFAGLAVDPTFPFAILASSWSMVFGIAALALLASVWCKTTRDAMLTVYVLGFAGLLCLYLFNPTLPGWLDAALSPLAALTLDDPTARWRPLASFVGIWLGIGLGAGLLASLRLRGAYCRQLNTSRRFLLRWFGRDRIKLRGNPVLWREQEMEGLAPLPFFRQFPRRLGMLAVFALSAGALVFFLVHTLPPGTNPLAFLWAGDIAQFLATFVSSPKTVDVFFWHGLAAMALWTLLVSIRASGAIAGEKEKDTWLGLMMTPLSTEKIVRGKHWGLFWATTPYVIAHAVATVPLAGLCGLQCLTWACLWILLSIPAILFGSAVGLFCSARAANSWRSLLLTLTIFYFAWLLFLAPISCILIAFKGMTELALMIVGLFEDTSGLMTTVQGLDIWAGAIWLGIAAAFWVLTERLLTAAVERVGRSDRSMEYDFGYYFLLRDYQRRKMTEPLEPLKVDYEDVPARKVKEPV
ncbi:MAG: ABC transporter permease [Gemmataceae bacterium]|nr:ABC transporter permease [Gemmataceae bacterium]